MPDDDLRAIHQRLLSFERRAERSSEETLIATFVDSAPLFDLLNTTHNQVIYGRRGTGKTHALKYLAEHVETTGDHAVYLDLRSVGSNGAIYGDQRRPLAERASTLLIDVLSSIHSELFRLAVSVIDKHPNPDIVTNRLDDLQRSITSIAVTGDITIEESNNSEKVENLGSSAGLIIDASGPRIEAGRQRNRGQTETSSLSSTRTGRERVRISFGDVVGSIQNLFQAVGATRIWLLVDEWSEVPVDLQPYLADLVRRAILPVRNITVKIAAIEHRTNFTLRRDRGEYIGIELGADVSADLNLDDFLVFDNDSDKAIAFFKSLLFKHYIGDEKEDDIQSAEQLVQILFTQHPVFEEFVRAAEGVPRDALNLAAKMATRAFGRKISMPDVRGAARDWYNQDKSAILRSSPTSRSLMDFIIEEVIGRRRARAFMFPSNIRHSEIDYLFDSRLLHLLKKNISAHDEPGARYDVYKIDYGCYVDLINTDRNPLGLFQVEESASFQEVPVDDYRSIRRAILRPNDIPDPAEV